MCVTCIISYVLNCLCRLPMEKLYQQNGSFIEMHQTRGCSYKGFENITIYILFWKVNTLDSFQWQHWCTFVLFLCPNWVSEIENQIHQQMQTLYKGQKQISEFLTVHIEEFYMLEPPSCKPKSMECTTDCRKVHRLHHLREAAAQLIL